MTTRMKVLLFSLIFFVFNILVADSSSFVSFLVYVFFIFSSGIELFSSGIGDAYYASNDMDPYLKTNGVCSFISLMFCHFVYVEKPNKRKFVFFLKTKRKIVVIRMMGMMRMMKRSRTSP